MIMPLSCRSKKLICCLVVLTFCSAYVIIVLSFSPGINHQLITTFSNTHSNNGVLKIRQRQRTSSNTIDDKIIFNHKSSLYNPPQQAVIGDNRDVVMRLSTNKGDDENDEVDEEITQPDSIVDNEDSTGTTQSLSASTIEEEESLISSIVDKAKNQKQQLSKSLAVALKSKASSDQGQPGRIRNAYPNVPWHNLPNALTYMRCFAIPVLVGLFYMPNRHFETSALFAVASFTDWLDGYLARRWNITSAFGAFLDPVADKLMVSTSLILLCGRYGPTVAIPTSIILAREIAVSALREWMAQRGRRDTVQVGFQGKVKTALTMISLIFLLMVPSPSSLSSTVSSSTTLLLFAMIQKIAIGMLYISSFITVTSGTEYFRAAGPVLFAADDDATAASAATTPKTTTTS